MISVMIRVEMEEKLQLILLSKQTLSAAQLHPFSIKCREPSHGLRTDAMA